MNKTIRKMIKADAKQSLSGKWGTAIVLSLLFVLVEGWGVALVQWSGYGFFVNGSIFALAGIALSAPILMGIVEWFLSSLRHEENADEKPFSWFTRERFFPALMVRLFVLLVGFACSLMAVLAMLIAFIPALFTRGGLYLFDQLRRGMYAIPYFDFPFYSVWPAMRYEIIGVFVLAGLLVLAVSALIIWFALRYSAVLNIVADNPKVGLDGAIRKSKEIMRGNCWTMVWFCLSFWGWVLLVPFTFGLVLLYVVPYFSASFILCVEYFRDQHAKKIRVAAERQIEEGMKNQPEEEMKTLLEDGDPSMETDGPVAE